KLDITAAEVDGRFDVVVLPDVYEHIQRTFYPNLHAQFDRLLTTTGRIVLTLPSAGYQTYLRASGKGLQPVDESVTIDDLCRLARDVSGDLTYFSVISVWMTNDYVDAVVERRGSQIRNIEIEDMLPIKAWPRRTFWHRVGGFVNHRLGVGTVRQS